MVIDQKAVDEATWPGLLEKYKAGSLSDYLKTYVEKRLKKTQENDERLKNNLPPGNEKIRPYENSTPQAGEEMA